MVTVERKCCSYIGSGGPSMASTTPETRPPMIHRITNFATRFPKSVIAFWLVLALALSVVPAAVGYKVMTDDTTEFLPKDSESAQAIAYARDAFGVQKGTRTVTMLVKRADGKALTAAD